MSKKKVCVILPCYKVKTKIYKIYKKTVNKKFDCTIFVDDFCPEKSVSFLKSNVPEGCVKPICKIVPPGAIDFIA